VINLIEFQEIRFKKRVTILICLLFSTVIVQLIMLGYPLPHIDDLIFIGTAFNYAQTGNLENPYCVGFLSQFGTIKHYYYMPGQAFLLGTYLKSIGISALKVLIFQWFFILIGIGSTYLVSNNILKLKTNTSIISAFIFFVIFIQTGLRPDALGFSLVLLGLFLFNNKNLFLKFIGIFLAGYGCFSAPLASGIFIPFFIYLLILQKKYQRIWHLTLAILALILILVLFGFIIEFKFQEFVSVFLLHKDFLGSERASFIHFIWLITENYQKVIKFPLYLLSFVLLILSLISKHNLHIIKNNILLVCCIGLSAVLYTEKTALHIGVFLCWWIIISYTETLKNSKLKVCYICMITTFFFINQSSLIISSIFQTNFSDYYRKEALKKPNSINCENIIFDSEAARYIYDYNLPKKSLSLNFFSKTFSPKSTSQYKKGTVWLLSASLAIRNNLKICGLDTTRIEIMGKKFHSLPQKPFQFLVYTNVFH
jgi:hypothetical protein